MRLIMLIYASIATYYFILNQTLTEKIRSKKEVQYKVIYINSIVVHTCDIIIIYWKKKYYNIVVQKYSKNASKMTVYTEILTKTIYII